MIFVSQLSTETNTFAYAPTGRGGFEGYSIYFGDASTRVFDCKMVGGGTPRASR
ncbi:M81 family metallopeptidase [Roseateles toxinivorans]|uniref:Uncharacterized protein n=1 Tax=Roseateles toxinivorans TaxID=270368 RepID=A0A4R6QQ56_9BURK|nr:M81 family metallopeptidase [Roseateles toxinivorans]TDP73030.1 hypothetical protein DES47_102776 [Roseateles toxinivorans]